MSQPSDYPPPDLSPGLRFVIGHWRVSRALGELLTPLIEREHHLTLKEYLVLSAICWGVQYPTELAEQLGMPKDMISRSVQALLKAGLIERAIDEQDSRRTRLAATPSGQERRAEVRATIEHTVEPFLTTLGSTQREHLLESLEALYTLLSQAPGDPRDHRSPSTTDL